MLLLDFDRELSTLFAQWLSDAGMRVARVGVNEAMVATLTSEVSATIVHLPFPRQGGVRRLLPRTQAVQGKPIVALSPAFRADIAPLGAVARELGVAAVLPTSVTRDALVGIVNSALRRAA